MFLTSFKASNSRNALRNIAECYCLYWIHSICSLS